MLAKNWIVLLKSKLFDSVHSIFGRVVVAMSGFLAHQSNDFAFVSFLCHIESYSNRYGLVLLVFFDLLLFFEMEPSSGFEPETPALPWQCSTTELRRHNRPILTDCACFGEWCFDTL